MQRQFRHPTVAILTLSLLTVFTVGLSAIPLENSASARNLSQPIDFTPNVYQLELTAAAATAIADGFRPAPITLAPGQLYGEEDRPDISHIEGGDEEFGYGPSRNDPSVYVIWMTDENGTHYFTVGAESDELLGALDESTGTRAQNGYVHLIKDHEEKKQEVLDKQEEVDRHQNLRMGSHGAALGVAVGGGIICGIVTGGACYVAFGVAAFTAWVSGVVQNSEKVSAQDQLETLESQQAFIEDQLTGKFGQTMRTTESPP